MHMCIQRPTAEHLSSYPSSAWDLLLFCNITHDKTEKPAEVLHWIDIDQVAFLIYSVVVHVSLGWMFPNWIAALFLVCLLFLALFCGSFEGKSEFLVMCFEKVQHKRCLELRKQFITLTWYFQIIKSCYCRTLFWENSESEKRSRLNVS